MIPCPGWRSTPIAPHPPQKSPEKTPIQVCDHNPREVAHLRPHTQEKPITYGQWCPPSCQQRLWNRAVAEPFLFSSDRLKMIPCPHFFSIFVVSVAGGDGCGGG